MFLASLITSAFALVPHDGGAPCATSALRSARIAGAGPAIEPPMRAESNGLDTEHFHIEGFDYEATDEELAEVGEVFEAVWAREIGEMGYRQPYGTESTLFNVYIERLGRGLYGYADVERDGKTAYIAVNADMSWTGTSARAALEVTAAHEFFHAVQFAYDYWEPSWWMEASSVWMEEQVYDANDDYLYYLGDDSWPDYPEISMVAENGWHEYGEGIWPMYLSEMHGGPETLRALWERTEAADAPDLFADHFGGNEAFEALLVDFHVRNALGYSGYEEGAAWWPVYRTDLGSDASVLPVTVSPEEWRTDYLGVNYFRLPLPESTPSSLEVSFTGGQTADGENVRWMVSLVGTDGSTWDSATETGRDAVTVTLGDFGTQWHEAWVLVTILSENTGISHDAYSSVPSYTKTPPEYSFTLVQGPPLEEDDTGTVDSGGDSGGDTGPIDCCKDKGDDPDEDPECGCATGGPAGLGVVLLAMLAGLRRRR